MFNYTNEIAVIIAAYLSVVFIKLLGCNSVATSVSWWWILMPFWLIPLMLCIITLWACAYIAWSCYILNKNHIKGENEI